MGIEAHRRKISNEKQAAIIRAAQEIFLTHGYTRAGMADIARDADVSTATLYKRFSSKEELFAAVVKDVARETVDYESLISQGDTARDILYKVARGYLSTQFDNHANALMRIVIAEVPGAPKLASEMYDLLSTRRHEKLRAVIDEMVRNKLLKPHDTEFGVRIGSGALKELFVWPALFDASYTLPPDTDEKIHRCIDAYLALFGVEENS